MVQLINYADDGTVMVYHTVPSQAGTTVFEHKNRVSLATLPHGKKRDGSDDPDVLMVTCPVPGCGARAWVSLTGDEEAQRLHARVRHARGEQPTYVRAAVDSVIADVKAKGGTPRLNPQMG